MKNLQMLALICCAILSGCGDPEPEEESKTPDTGPPVAKADSPPPPAVSHPLPGDPVAGAEVYKRICIACHQADGSGMNGMLAANFVTDKTRLAKSNEVLLNSIRNGITNGTKVMPPQKDILTDKQIKDALSYIRKTFGDSR